MKIYILIEHVFEPCNESYINIIGAFNTLEKAENRKNKIIKENIKNYDFIMDNQSKNRIFNTFQENWENYIEYYLEEKEVL